MPEPTTPEQIAEWEKWLDERPPHVREIAEEFPPWPTYRLTTTGQYAAITQYDEHEDGRVTVRVNVWRDWLPLVHGVFGIDPRSLERVS